MGTRASGAKRERDSVIAGATPPPRNRPRRPRRVEPGKDREESVPRAPGIRVASVLATIAAILPYANVLGLGFVGDDFPLIVENPRIRSLDGVLSLLGLHGGSPAPRALRDATYALDAAIGGGEAWTFHLSSLVYHVLATLLVLFLARRLAGDGWASLAAALVFAVHPVHSEAVASVAGRKDVLVTLFTAAGLLAFLRFQEDGRLRWVGAFAACLALGFLVKETIVVLPALALPCALFGGRDGVRRARRRALIAAACFCIGSLLLAIVAVGVFRVSALAGGGAWRWHGGSWVSTYVTVPRLLLFDLGLLALPVRLQADYGFDAFPIGRSPLEPRFVVAVLALAAIAALAVRASRRDRRVGIAAAWILVTLLPVLQIVPHHELLAERYLYLPSVGAALLAGILFERLAATRHRAATGALAAVLLLAVARTWTNNRVYADFETLSRSVVERSPRCARAHYNLGQLALRRGDEEEALERFRAAIAVGPGSFPGENRVFGPAWNEIGLVSLVRFLRGERLPASREYAEAKAALERAADAWPGEAAPALNLYTLEREAGRGAEAIRVLARAAAQGVRDARVDERLAAASPSLVEEPHRREVVAAIVRRMRAAPSADSSVASAEALVEHLRRSGDPAAALLVARTCGLEPPAGAAKELWRSLTSSDDKGARKRLATILAESLARAREAELVVECGTADWPAGASEVSHAFDRMRPWVVAWLVAERLGDVRAKPLREGLRDAMRSLFGGFGEGQNFRGIRFSVQDD
jgi:tetratricopeptide (TPR) repeat protein